jgi:hypothetical protein
MDTLRGALKTILERARPRLFAGIPISTAEYCRLASASKEQRTREEELRMGDFLLVHFRDLQPASCLLPESNESCHRLEDDAVHALIMARHDCWHALGQLVLDNPLEVDCAPSKSLEELLEYPRSWSKV